MGKESLLQKRFKRQSAELLAIIQTEPQVSPAELVSRTGMSHGAVKRRLAALRDEGKIAVNHDLQRSVSATTLSPASLEQRVSELEQRVLKLLAQ